MIEVQLNKTNTNPFFGLSNCLRLFGASNNNVISESQLNSAWNEVKDTKEKRELFYSILFSIGDITNRQHNIFKGKKKDSRFDFLQNAQNFENKVAKAAQG